MAFQFNPQSQERVPDMPPPRERISRFTLVILGGMMLLLALLAAWSPLSRAVKAALGRRHAAAARSALAKQDMEAATPELVAARRWAPEEAEVLRATVEYLNVVKTDPSTLVQQIKLLAEKRALTPDETLMLGRALVATRKTAEARALYEKMTAGAAASPESLELLSELLAAEGHSTEAAEVQRRSSRLKKDAPEARLQLAIEDRNHVFPEIRRQARAELWELAALDTPVGLAAANSLRQDPSIDLAETRRLLELVEKNPKHTLRDRLQILSVILRLESGSRAKILDDEIARFRSKEDDGRENNGDLMDLAAWLASEKEHERLLAMVPANLAAHSRPLYVAVLESLAAQGKWQEIKDRLKQKRPPISETLFAVWMADVESHLQPDLTESRRLLTAAIEIATAKLNAEELYTAALLAERLNQHDLSCSGYQALASLLPQKETLFLQKAYDEALQQKDAGALLAIARKLHELRPSSVAYAERFDYMRLLLGVEIETVTLARPRAGTEDETNKLDHICPELLRALAAYRMGEGDKLRAQLGTLPDTQGLPAGQRAVIAGLLAISGGGARAFQIAERVPETLLLEEERLFLRRAK